MILPGGGDLARGAVGQALVGADGIQSAVRRLTLSRRRCPGPWAKWAGASWRRDRPERGPAGRLSELFSEFADPAATLLDALDAAADIHVSTIEEVALDCWAHGRVVLIGDAAHATSPNMAQGAAPGAPRSSPSTLLSSDRHDSVARQQPRLAIETEGRARRHQSGVPSKAPTPDYDRALGHQRKKAAFGKRPPIFIRPRVADRP